MKNLQKKTIASLFLCAITFMGFAGERCDLMDVYDRLPFRMNMPDAIKFPKNKVVITDFGAKGDGLTDNTEAFNKAIEAVSNKGGGKVIVPEGLWITGPIVFKSNINLHLLKGALLKFSTDKSKYPIIKTSFEGFETRRCLSPIYGKDLKNIAITGQGVIDGSGEVWRPVKKSKLTDEQWKKLIAKGGVLNEEKNTWYPSEGYLKALPLIIDQNVPKITHEEQWTEIKDFLRPVMVSFVNCTNVELDGVTFQNSPAWCIHPLMCQNVRICNINVRNPWYSQNGDGLDLESCKNCLVYNSSFDVGDDAICIKSGKDADGRKRAIPTENVIVYKCMVYHGHGGFVVGSEMSSGVKNIYVENCLFMGTDAGLRFKSKRGRGGVVENIHINNVHMTDIETDPIIFDLFYGGKHGIDAVNDEKNQDKTIQPITEETPTFKDIYIKNITCNGALRAFFFNGLPEMNVQNINLENISITSTYGATLNESDDIKMRNITINASKGNMMNLYNVKNVVLNNVSSSNPQNDSLKIDGATTKKIAIKNSSLKKENIQSSVSEETINIE
jgi:polygalacturonase